MYGKKKAFVGKRKPEPSDSLGYLKDEELAQRCIGQHQ